MGTRRDLMCGAAFALIALWSDTSALGQAAAPASPDRLILLGTKGGPSIRGLKPMPSSSVLVINDVPFIVDAGYATTHRLVEARIALPTIRYVFITHLHSDHVLELGPLLYNAWANGLNRASMSMAQAALKRSWKATGPR
jgi:ribonuclease BN (tRNA processing enzyme)